MHRVRWSCAFHPYINHCKSRCSAIIASGNVVNPTINNPPISPYKDVNGQTSSQMDQNGRSAALALGESHFRLNITNPPRKKKTETPNFHRLPLAPGSLGTVVNHARSLHVLRDGGVCSDPVLVHQGDQLAFLPRRRPMIHEWRISWPWLKTRVGMRSGVTIVPNSSKPKANQFNRCWVTYLSLSIYNPYLDRGNWKGYTFYIVLVMPQNDGVSLKMVFISPELLISDQNSPWAKLQIVGWFRRIARQGHLIHFEPERKSVTVYKMLKFHVGWEMNLQGVCEKCTKKTPRHYKYLQISIDARNSFGTLLMFIHLW